MIGDSCYSTDNYRLSEEIDTNAEFSRARQLPSVFSSSRLGLGLWWYVLLWGLQRFLVIVLLVVMVSVLGIWDFVLARVFSYPFGFLDLRTCLYLKAPVRLCCCFSCIMVVWVFFLSGSSSMIYGKTRDAFRRWILLYGSWVWFPACWNSWSCDACKLVIFLVSTVVVTGLMCARSSGSFLVHRILSETGDVVQ